MESSQSLGMSTDLPALLIPVANQCNLLLPGVTVAEIVHMAEIEPVEDAPVWLLGTIAWRTQRIPLVSYELLNGQPVDYGDRLPIAVLNGSEDADALPFYAIPTQATPRLLRLSDSDVAADPDGELGPLDALAVRLHGEPMVIPDVAAIEREILPLLQSLRQPVVSDSE